MTQLDKCLAQQVALVTGASSGIGRAIALALAARGATICAMARRKPELEALAGEVREMGCIAQVCCADLTSDADIQAIPAAIEREFGRLDILVLSGGAIRHSPLETASLADFDLLYRSNIRGHYALIQVVLPLLRRQKGQIGFVNSSAGLRAAAGAGQFAATQFGSRALAESLREEVNGDGIRVLSVYPGRTATPRMEGVFAKEGRLYRPELLMQPEDVATMMAQAMSLPRTAEVTDIFMRPMMKSY